MRTAKTTPLVGRAARAPARGRPSTASPCSRLSRCRPSSVARAASLVPSIGEIEERACVEMAERLESVDLTLPGHAESVEVTFIGPKAKGKPVIILLHGFDSSCLEFRRVFPLLEKDFSVYAVDVLGWGFTNSKGQDCGPRFKTGVVAEFIRSIAGEGGPVTVLGASLGGAIAIDLAATKPDLVSKLVLVDAQGFQDGIGALQYLPDFVTKLFLEILRSVPLRNQANKVRPHPDSIVTPCLASPFPDALSVSLSLSWIVCGSR